MIKNAIFILLFFSLNQICAQEVPRNQIYFSGAITAGNYYGIDFHANYLLNGKYALKAGYSGLIRSPEAAPQDYSPGLLGALTFGLGAPYDKLGNYHVMAGRIYNVNKKGTIRLNLSLGLGLVAIKEPANWQRTQGGFVMQNYSFDYRKYHTLGVIINPKIELPFTRYYGLTISPMLHFNKDRTYVGIGIGQMLGTLRKDSYNNPAVEVVK